MEIITIASAVIFLISTFIAYKYSQKELNKNDLMILKSYKNRLSKNKIKRLKDTRFFNKGLNFNQFEIYDFAKKNKVPVGEILLAIKINSLKQG
jgi:hypothetical protein